MPPPFLFPCSRAENSDYTRRLFQAFGRVDEAPWRQFWALYFSRELCAELFGYAAEAGGVRSAEFGAAVLADHKTRLVRLQQGRVRLP